MSGRGRQSSSPPQQGQRQIQPLNLVYQIGQGPEEYSYNQQGIVYNNELAPSGKFAMQTGHPQQNQYNMYAQQRPQGMSAMSANSQPFYSNPSSQMRPRFNAPSSQMYMQNAQMSMYPQQVTLINANAVPFQMTQQMPGPRYPSAMTTNQSSMYPSVPPQNMPYQAHNPAVYFTQPQNTNRPPSAQPPTNVQKPARKGIPIIDPVSGEDITANLKPAKSEASTSDSSSRSTPVNVGEVSVSQPPAAQSPYNLNVAAQFAAQVAATLDKDKDHAHHPPDQQGAPGDYPHPQAPATAVDKTHVVPPQGQINTKPITALPGLANGETPVTVQVPNTLPAQHHTSVPDSSGGYSYSSKVSSKSDVTLPRTVPAASQQAPVRQISAEPVQQATDSVHSVSASDTTKSASVRTEATPEVRVVPPTPVEKTSPEIAEKPTNSSEAKTAESIIPGKKEKSKKKPRDINKRGEMIQGTEFDAYVDDTPLQKEEPVEKEKPALAVSQPEPIVTSPVVIEPAVKPEVSVPAHKEAPTPTFKEPLPVTVTTKTAAATEDVVPKVEISIEDACESEHQDVLEDDLEEGEIRDDEEEDETLAMLRYKYQEDQWSPLNPEGKKHYDREFLLQFQFDSAAITKPAGLPDLPDVILDKPIVSTGRPYIKEMPSGPGADFADFTPKYYWPGASGGSKSRSGMPRQPSNQKNKSSSAPTRQINLSISKDIELHKAEKAWKPGHLEPNKEKEVEIDDATEDLYKKTRSILNKLTPQKFQVLLSQMQALKIDTESKLKGVIDLVFEKAISEPNFSVAYANMCRCLSMFKVQSDSKSNEMVNFRAVLLTRCQREFEKDKSSEAVFVTKREEIEKCEDAVKKEELKHDLDYEESKAKRRSLGNIRFIGELFKLKMLTENIMHDCVFKLLRSKDAESLECLCRLLTTIGKELDSDKARPRMDQYFQQMDKIVNDKKNSARVRFMLQDMIDLRKNNWIPRRVDNNPKTIDQIHKEVEKENQEKAFLSQQAQMQNKSQGGRGGRRGPPSGQMGGQAGSDGWNMVGAQRTPLKVDRSIDPSKMKISRQNVDDSIQLGPGGGAGRFAGWGRGSTGGTAGGRASMEKEKQQQNTAPANRFSALSKPEEDSSRRVGGSSPARGDSRGSRGGFGRPNLSMQLSQEQEREKAVAATKAIVANQHQEEYVSREGRGRGRGSSAEPRPTTVTPPPAVVPSNNAKVLPHDEMEKKTKAILDEYFQIHDVKEAQDCVKEIAEANHRHFVSSAMNHVLERSSQSRKQTGFLLHGLVKQQIISVDSYISGLLEVLEFAEDLEIDIPKIWQYYGEMISPMIQDSSVPLSFLKTAVGPLSQTNKAGVLLAEILHDASHREGHKKVAGLWTSSGLTWSDFVPRNQIEQFLQDKGLEFTKGGDSAPSTPTTGLPIVQISERLHELIVDKRLNNEAVFDWIESNVDEPTIKSKKFIRALMTAVCTSAIKGDKGKEKLEPKDLSARNDLLQKYLDHQPEFELQALYALQVLITRLEHPQGLLRGMFDILYDDDVISEDAFMQWERSDEEPEGKGTALKQVVQFFTWLNEAEEDS
ncbi:eukaryotic translation initiation factor 4 gamma 1-like isoform X2 [Dreissena polymorpha]|uniref:eukaryotic translation initiation factor 4 gamma 1-like isoform X2 n=1 Tax=Dreissena polymorpha TaxID=45954 RepID=UPI0022650638|nr:eukaryotic translation initiation factor 4 gamma 1-like isoform X2 [Dreissena polymorpha]